MNSPNKALSAEWTTATIARSLKLVGQSDGLVTTGRRAELDIMPTVDGRKKETGTTWYFGYLYTAAAAFWIFRPSV